MFSSSLFSSRGTTPICSSHNASTRHLFSRSIKTAMLSIVVWRTLVFLHRCWTAASRGRGPEMKLARCWREVKRVSASRPATKAPDPHKSHPPQQRRRIQGNPGTHGVTVRMSSLSAWVTRETQMSHIPRGMRVEVKTKQREGCIPTTTWLYSTLQSLSTSPSHR